MEIKQDMDFRDLENNCWGRATIDTLFFLIIFS